MIENLLRRAANLFDSPDPLIILPYRGYANAQRFFLKGRVLENEGVFEGKSEGRLRNLLDSFRRFETDELAGANLRIQLQGKEYLASTDAEGFFTLDLPWQAPADGRLWAAAAVQLLEGIASSATHKVQASGEVFCPSANASFGIISDIDDTMLQSHMTSRLKLKLVYATLFQDSHQRLPMEGVPALMQALERGGNGQRQNPVFYVSDSPWNLYEMLAEFMRLHELPKGPILLRDYGPHLLRKGKGRPVHKLDAFRHILQMYPKLPFVMLGDTASKDADYYLQMMEEFPGQVLAIYVRQTKDTDNARRVAELLAPHRDKGAMLVHSSAEMLDDAVRRGLVA